MGLTLIPLVMDLQFKNLNYLENWLRLINLCRIIFISQYKIMTHVVWLDLNYSEAVWSHVQWESTVYFLKTLGSKAMNGNEYGSCMSCPTYILINLKSYYLNLLQIQVKNLPKNSKPVQFFKKKGKFIMYLNLSD